MTTEEDFNRLLDADPSDWQTRLIYADWLQERGDLRAEGYRALGQLRKRPQRWDGEEKRGEFWWLTRKESKDGVHTVSPDWFNLIILDGTTKDFAPERAYRENCSRRTVEDAAALAFAKLPADRRAELLRVEVLT